MGVGRGYVGRTRGSVSVCLETSGRTVRRALGSNRYGCKHAEALFESNLGGRVIATPLRTRLFGQPPSFFLCLSSAAHLIGGGLLRGATLLPCARVGRTHCTSLATLRTIPGNNAFRALRARGGATHARHLSVSQSLRVRRCRGRQQLPTRTVQLSVLAAGRPVVLRFRRCTLFDFGHSLLLLWWPDRALLRGWAFAACRLDGPTGLGTCPAGQNFGVGRSCSRP